MAELSVGVRKLKAQLSEYLDLVQSGQTILVTERGAPIGRIVPVARSAEDAVRLMVEAGVAQWNGERFQPGAPAAEAQPGRSVADLVSEQREQPLDYLSGH
jgi:prevent-host-death family protein